MCSDPHQHGLHGAAACRWQANTDDNGHDVCEPLGRGDEHDLPVPLHDFAPRRSRYAGESPGVGALPALPVIPVKNGNVTEVYYNDLQAEYRLPEHQMSVTVGVNNVFDAMPPASYANAPINFDIYTYDILGRNFFIRLNASRSKALPVRPLLSRPDGTRPVLSRMSCFKGIHDRSAGP